MMIIVVWAMRIVCKCMCVRICIIVVRKIATYQHIYNYRGIKLPNEMFWSIKWSDLERSSICTECKYFAIIAVYPKINAIALILLLNLDIPKGEQGDMVQSMRG